MNSNKLFNFAPQIFTSKTFQNDEGALGTIAVQKQEMLVGLKTEIEL